MFAVIKTGGKQYKVATNDEIVIEKIDGDAGDEHTFGEVLMLGDGDKVTVGEPTVKGAAVTGEVVETRKGEKVLIVKKRRRSTYRRKKGHRQIETVIKITAILPDGVKAVAPKKKVAKTETVEAVAIEEAPKKAAPKAKAEPKTEEKPKTEAKPKAAPKAKAADKPEVDARGRLKAPQGKADDLKQIKGVGPVLEKKLNEAGIFHYWQVAALNAKQIEELENDMSFPGRVERDDWVAQAKELAKNA